MFFNEPSHKNRKTVLLQRLIRRKEMLLQQLREHYPRHRFQIAYLEERILQKEILLQNSSAQQRALLEKELDELFQQRLELNNQKEQLLRHFQQLQISLAKLKIYTLYWKIYLSQEKHPEKPFSSSG